MKRVEDNPVRADFMYYVWLFFLTAVFGWLWEGRLYLLKDEMYVNRGFLTGPWLPIYGTGAVMLEILLHKWRDRPAMVFLLSMLLCTILEYAAGWYLETAWGIKWWDYSQVPFHFQGRICLLSSLLFGAGGMLLVWLASPFLYSVYWRIPARCRVVLGLLAIGLFVADATYSAVLPHVGKGITYTILKTTAK